MRLLTLNDIKKIIRRIGIETCLIELIGALEKDFSQWETFKKMPRIATHFPKGVIELMPICGKDYYAYKYVNGHPDNPQQKKLTVVAVGMLSEVDSGYPMLFSAMTILTALRTAATCALASKYLARKNSKTIGIIGTGSQSEFQILALKTLFDIDTIRYFDIDPEAMEKFRNNLSTFDFVLVPCNDGESTVEDVDIIVTATADKKRLSILKRDWVKPGMHINGVGGDCPGKTELDPEILNHTKIVVEYLEQSKLEGEIQNLEGEPYAELWELVSKEKPGRESNEDITLFDSVGFALEDYTILKYFYSLSEKMNIGEIIDIIPSMDNPKDLFGFLKNGS